MSGPVKDGGPAFPVIETVPRDIGHGGEYTTISDTYSSGGMTLRDYFAAKAMQIVSEAASDESIESAAEEIGIEAEDYKWRKHWPMLIAKRAYEYADAMIRARENITGATK